MKLTLEQIKEKLRQELPFLAHRYDVVSLSIFGSYVRQSAGVESDLDLLVTFEQVPGLIKFMALENYLSDLLGLKVDLVMPDALKPQIGRQILSEAVAV